MFSLRNVKSEEQAQVSSGRLFHAHAAATGKLRSSRVARRVNGTCCVVVSAEQRHRRATISDVGRRLSDRYAVLHVLMLHRTEIWAVWRPQLGRKKVWRFLMQQFNCCTFAAQCASALSCWNKVVTRHCVSLAAVCRHYDVVKQHRRSQ